jgi:hypothetical protein
VLEILRSAGKLGAVELRNRTWFDTEKHACRTLEFLGASSSPRAHVQ